MTLPGILVDTSSNNGDPSGWNFPQMKAAGVTAILAKATESTNYTNPYFTKIRQLARAAGIHFAAYHFANFAGDAGAQARYFMSVAGGDAKILDSETSSNEAWQNAFLAGLNLNPSQEMDYGSVSTLPKSGVRGLLWPAAYGSTPGFGDVWQFTDNRVVAGCPVPLDASVWTGSQASFDTFFGTALVGTGGGVVPAVTGNFPKAIAADATADGLGDWVVGTDGGVFCVGTAQFYGSLPGLKVVANNIVGIFRSWGGQGYYMLGADGGVFCFGDAIPAQPIESYPGLPADARQGSRSFGTMKLHWGGNGYTLIALDGSRYSFGS